MKNIKGEFIQQLRASFPQLENEPLEELVSDQLVSPFHVELPSSVLTQAQNFIEKIFAIRELPAYQKLYSDALAEKGIRDPGNKSIMMSYDFHTDENQNLKLIEINTNAAFLALGTEMYKAHKIPLPVSDFSFAEVKAEIETELRLNGRVPSQPLKVAITDEDPASQRLYVEFLVYRELFKSWGWVCTIEDYRELFKNSSPDFIYNRHTDFFLSDPTSAVLKEKFLNREVCLSPNPYEYLMLADKNRMVEWSQPGFFEALGVDSNSADFLRSIVPRSLDVKSDNVEELWAQRKKLFFKPKNAYGSKQSYRGENISRKAFDGLKHEETLAQEYVPAPEREFVTPEGPQKFKFDLRCYAYQGRLQLVLARLYQGQVTNLRAPYGGFACVTFV
ncbi:hypothetical protein [Bdellovibrio sp. HCB2-146]|uniref:hypothetical protein n=1 Tax=Bdellovibrio sp. HCB2-146 TaxID=3394362 RepID=UPI0039BD8CAB